MKSESHKKLMAVLKKMVVQEKWRKMKKCKGTILDKAFTKKGNIKLILNTSRGNITSYVLKRNKNLFQRAEMAKPGDRASITTRTYLGKAYCTKVIVSKTEK